MTATLTCTFDSSLSRVKLAASGLNAATIKFVLVRWDNGEPKTAPNAFTVRVAQPTSTTTTGAFSDYEFIPSVANSYQLTTFNSSGTLLDTVVASDITPSQTVAWVKDIARPFNNLAIETIDVSAVSYATRSSSFSVLNRELPVAITDVQGGRSFTLTVRTPDANSRVSMQQLLSNGAVLFLQVPDDSTMPSTGYFAVGQVNMSVPPSPHLTPVKYFEIPLVEVAAPDSSIIGTTATWASIVANFTAWGTGTGTVTGTFASWTAVNSYVAP